MLTRWSDFDGTFTLFDELRRRMDRLWDEYDDGGRGLFFEPTVRREAWPRVNLYDKGSTLALYAELPGFEDKDVELTIN